MFQSAIFIGTSPPIAYRNSIPKDLEYSRTADGRAMIPASSIRGWVRARARKIRLTQRHAQNPEIALEDLAQEVDSFLESLFGSTERRGLLRFDHFIAVNHGEHEQMFNAVDRFHGGVADTALYHAKAATATVLRGCIRLPRELDQESKALLRWVERDAMEGDLRLGWGKGRGYGHFSCRRAQIRQGTEQGQIRIVQRARERGNTQPHHV